MPVVLGHASLCRYNAYHSRPMNVALIRPPQPGSICWMPRVASKGRRTFHNEAQRTPTQLCSASDSRNQSTRLVPLHRATSGTGLWYREWASPVHEQPIYRKRGVVCESSCCSSAAPANGSGHSHDHGHSHGHHHHLPDNSVSRALGSVGLVKLASKLEHSGACTVASVLFFVASIVAALPAVSHMIGSSLSSWIHNAGLLGTFLLSGIPQTVESLSLAGSGIIDTHVLMTLAVLGTLYMGMAQEGALLVLLFQVSHTLEEKFTARAQGSLERLFSNVPTQAMLVELDPVTGDPELNSATQTLARRVQPGQHVLVKPGEQVPLDGEVVWGTANVSMQHISGESQPVRMAVGSSVPAGSLNSDGLLVVQVTATADDSTPARIARMAAAAQTAKPKLQRTLEQVGQIWSKAVIGATLLTLLVLPLMGVPLLGAHGALYRAMGVLTAGSPCAVVLVPLAYVCAIATITRKGVLVKSAGSLDALHECGTVALDKTGTITTGSLTLTSALVLTPTDITPIKLPELLSPSPSASPVSSSSEIASNPRRSSEQQGSAPQQTTLSSMASGSSFSDELFQPQDLGFDALQYAVALSRVSNHPVARAVVDAAGESAALDVAVSQFEQVPGSGVHALCQRGPWPPVTVRFGSVDFIRESLAEGCHMAGPLDQALSDQRRAGSKAMSVLSVSPMTGGSPHFVAVFCFEDLIQGGVESAVRELQSGTWKRNGGPEHRKEVVMLTGDNLAVAEQVASSVGIGAFMAALKPEDKLKFVTAFTNKQSSSKETDGQRGGLLMMGDGINDAPALAAAHVGVAVAATPSDMVAAAADIIVLNGNGVVNLPWLFKIASKTRSIIRQNLTLALLSVVFATLPVVAGFIPLWLAVLLHEGSTLLVALNSLRLLLDPQTNTLREAISSTVQAMGEMFATDSDHHHHHHHHGHDHDHHHDHDHDHDHDHHHDHKAVKGSKVEVHAHAEGKACNHDHDHDHCHDHDHDHSHPEKKPAKASEVDEKVDTLQPVSAKQKLA